MSEAPFSDATQRFSNLVADYQRYRPGYPSGVFDYLIERCALTTDSVVVDVGAGTGLFTEPWLARGLRVQAVEPNAEMRAAAAHALAAYPRLQLIDAPAEALPLQDASAALITSAQAFHWFELAATRAEFQRVLQPNGCVALIWNERAKKNSQFLREYEEVLRAHSNDYDKITHHGRATSRVVEFFAPGAVTERRFDNAQAFDFEGLCGRVLSSSYAPKPGHPEHEPMLASLRRLFDKYASAGEVVFVYRTRVFIGQLD